MTAVLEPTTAGVTVSAPASELARAMANAVLFSAKESHRPTLYSVRLTLEGDTLTLESTDSYALYRERLAVAAPAGAPALQMLFDRRDAEAIAKACKAAKRDTAYVAFTAAGLVVEVGAVTLAARAGDWDYPNVEVLRSGWVSDAAHEFGVSGPMLARLGKVVPADGIGSTGPTLKFETAGSLRPLRVTVGSSIDLLVMPVRVA